MDALGDVVALAEGEPAADGGARGGGPHGVEGVDVERQVDRGVVADVGEGHLHDAADAVAGAVVSICHFYEGGKKTKREQGHLPVNVKHAKRLDPILPQNPLLPGVHVPKADVHQLPQTQAVLLLDPAEVLLLVLDRQPRQERDGHAVHVAAAARLGGIDVSVGVDPNDRDLAAEALADGPRGAADGADGDAVVAAEGEDEAAEGGVLVDLVGDAAGDGGDGLGVLHAAVGGIGAGGGHEVGVEVDGVVAVELVAELVAELGEEAGLDEGGGGGVDAGLALAAGEADGHDAQVLGVREEPGLDHGGVQALVVAVGVVALQRDAGLAFLGPIGGVGGVGGVDGVARQGGAVFEGGRCHFVGDWQEVFLVVGVCSLLFVVCRCICRFVGRFVGRFAGSS